jgi:hypothetical protein
VGDDQEGRALGAQAAHQREEDIHLMRAEGGGRLVQDHQPGIQGEGAQDLDHLLFGDGEIADFPFGVNRQIPAEAVCQVVGGLVDGPPVQPPAAAIGVLMDEEDVFRDREVRDEAQLLQDDGDASAGGVAGGAEGDGRAVPLDGPAVGLLDAGDDLGHRRFAGAVLPHQGNNFSRPHLQRNAFQRVDASIVLADALRAEERCGHVRVPVSRHLGCRWPVLCPRRGDARMDIARRTPWRYAPAMEKPSRLDHRWTRGVRTPAADLAGCDR